MRRIKRLNVTISVILMCFSTVAVADTIPVNDDLTIRSGVNKNATSPFGLFVKIENQDVSFLEFTLGNDLVSEAKLVLENNFGETSGPWDINLKAAQLDIDETTFTGTDTSGWEDIGDLLDVLAKGLYEVDLTSWYNANLGKTMTIELSTLAYPASTSSGPIFEDHEGTVGGGTPPHIDIVLANAIPPESASNPAPSGTNVPVNTYLSWTAGTGTTSHNVYFGQTNPPSLTINQTETTYDPGTLELNATYYWQIEEVNPYGTTPGTIWSFTTEPTATNTIATGWWRFDELIGSTARDASINDNNGTLVNMDSSDWVPGQYGNALDFNSIEDNYVQIPNASILQNGTQLAAEAWIKTTDTNTWGTIIGTGDAGWVMARNNTGMTTGFWLSTGLVIVNNNNVVVNDGQWHHVAAVYDGSAVYLYVDETVVSSDQKWGGGTITPGGSINSSGYSVHIGKNPYTEAHSIPSDPRFWDGLIDEVKIYNDADEFMYHWDNPNHAWAPLGPVPADSNMLESELTWSAGDSATSHDVYFGTDETTVTNAQRPAGDMDGNGAVNIDDLTMIANQWITDTNFEDFAVLAADWGLTADTVFKGNQTATTYNAGTLEYGTTYYWRIDEVNASDPSSPWKGRVWSFKPAIRIMPLGDSITFDNYTNDPLEDPRPYSMRTGYRSHLWYALEGAGYPVDFVGSVVAGEDVVPAFDPDNEGHPGWRDDQIADNIYGWLQSTPADVILLHIGTNALDTNPNDVEDILDEIDRYENDYNTHITVLLARIINRITYNSTTTTFNINVANMAQARINNGDDIIIVDMENDAGIDYSTDMINELHPNDTGYQKMASLWFSTLQTVLP